MKFSKELIEKAKTAKSAEELLEMAKAEHIELTAEQAAKAFAELNKTGELSDEELDNVVGGCGREYEPSVDTPKFHVGDSIDDGSSGYRTAYSSKSNLRFKREIVYERRQRIYLQH